MKRIKLFKKVLVITVLSLSLLGCGKKETDVAVSENSNNEEEIITETENEKQENTEELEETEKEDDTENVDLEELEINMWKEIGEKEKNCIVVINDKMSSQLIMRSRGAGGEKAVPYIMEDGDTIYIPLNDNMKDIFLYYCDGSSDSITLYSIGSVGVDYHIIDMYGTKVIKVEEELKKDFYLMINTTEADDYIYYLIGYDNAQN